MWLFGRYSTIAFLAVMLASSNSLLHAQDTLYRLFVLNSTEPGAQAKAYAINNTGQVVGWMSTGANRHAAHWFVEMTTDLDGTLHFALKHHILFNEGYQEAFNISNADQIVGTARHSLTCPPDILFSQAFIMRPAVLTDLATPYPGDALTRLGTFGDPCNGAYNSAAVGINNYDQVVGWADLENGTTHAFVSQSVGGLMDLKTFRGDTDSVSAATAVNDSGVITGYSYTKAREIDAPVPKNSTVYHAFMIIPNDTNADGLGDEWYVAAADGANALMQDLGTLGGYNSWGRDINNTGQIVGESDTNPANTTGNNLTRAFLWDNGQMTDLGGLVSNGFSAASGINDDGAIVGWANNADNQRRAVIFKDGKVYDLNDLICTTNEDGTLSVPSITLTEARDVNEDGWIVGWGNTRGSSNSGTRGFLLIPMDADDCPEQLVPGGHTNNGGSGGAGTGAGGTPIVGTPKTLTDGSQSSDNNDGSGGTVPVGLCGFGLINFTPILFAGLVCMKLGRRRIG